MQPRFGGMQQNKEKEGMGNIKNMRNNPERLNSFCSQMASLVTFQKAAVMKMKAMLGIQYISNCQTELELY